MRALRIFSGFESVRFALTSYSDDTAEGIEFDSQPYSKDVGLTIGAPGSAGFGVALSSIDGSVAFTQIIHTPSGSVFALPPSTSPIPPTPDPYADPTAAGFTFNGNPFPIPTAGYTVGVAGAQHFGIATNLDNSTAIIDPIHTASLSIM